MFETAICQIIFYIFAALALISAVGVFTFRNPVASALSMALCFGMTAAIFFGLGAQFMGIVQVIVYAGAILVLFLFVVMMLDVKIEEKTPISWTRAIMGTVVAGLFAGLIANVALSLPGARDGSCPVTALCNSCSELINGETPAAEQKTPAQYGGALPDLNCQVANKLAKPGMSDDCAAKATDFPDTKLLGATLFGKYSLHFVILSFALLAGTVGSVALARKIRKD